MHRTFRDGAVERWSGGPETRCESCGESFRVEVTYELRADRGEDCYFACPHCAFCYYSAYVPEAGVALRKQINELTDGGELQRAGELVEQLQACVEREPPEGLAEWV